jgi:hypothetical protein
MAVVGREHWMSLMDRLSTVCLMLKGPNMPRKYYKPKSPKPWIISNLSTAHLLL